MQRFYEFEFEFEFESKRKKIENVNLEMHTLDVAQSTQNAQNLHNENTTHDIKKRNHSILNRVSKRSSMQKWKKLSHI